MKIEVRDGLSFEELEFDFFSKKLAQVVGEKPDGGSNGAGKSNFLECLNLALYGETSRGIPQAELIHDGAEEAVYAAEWGRYRVERRFRPKESAKFFVDGEDQKCFSLAAVKSKVEEAFMEHQLFISCIYYAQSQTEFFVNTADSKQKGLLENILRFSRFTNAAGRAKLKRQALERQMSSLNIAAVQAQLSQAREDLAGLKKSEAEERAEREEKKDQLKEKLKRLRRPLSDMKALASKVTMAKRSYEAKKATSKADEEALISAQTASLETERKAGEAEGVACYNEESKKHAEEALEELQKKIGKPCPTCGVPMGKSSLQNAISKQEKAIQAYDKAIFTSRCSYADCQAKSLEISRTIQRLSKRLSELQTLKATLDSAESALAAAKEKETERLEEVQEVEDDLAALDEPSRLEDQMVAKVHQINKLKKDMARLEKQQQELTEEIELYSFWETGFGNSGIKSLLLDQHASFINSRINHYLNDVTHGDIRAKFSAQTKLKSEELRDKISFTIWVYGKPHDYKTYSGGQKTLINLAAIFALRDLSREQGIHYPLLLLDETFKELDPLYSTAVMALLRSMAKTEHIYVVSHNDALKDFITDTVMVRLGEDKVSRLEV